MDKYAFFIIVGAVIFILFFIKLLYKPIKLGAKLVLNSISGIGILYIINWIGYNFSFYIAINWWTILISGLLGIPGAILIIMLKLTILI